MMMVTKDDKVAQAVATDSKGEPRKLNPAQLESIRQTGQFQVVCIVITTLIILNEKIAPWRNGKPRCALGRGCHKSCTAGTSPCSSAQPPKNVSIPSFPNWSKFIHIKIVQHGLIVDTSILQQYVT